MAAKTRTLSHAAANAAATPFQVVMPLPRDPKPRGSYYARSPGSVTLNLLSDERRIAELLRYTGTEGLRIYLAKIDALPMAYKERYAIIELREAVALNIKVSQ